MSPAVAQASLPATGAEYRQECRQDACATATVVTVLRHGAVAGRPFVYRGKLDDPLSPLGWQQMNNVVAAGLPALTAIASSPLRRCREFAETIAAQHQLPLTVSAAFAELDFGTWEGLTPEEAAHRDPEAHARFRAGEAAPGGESQADLASRAWAGWQDWLQAPEGCERLLITHAGVMRALLLRLLDLPASHAWRFALPEAASFRVSLLAGEAPILLSLNPCAA